MQSYTIMYGSKWCGTFLRIHVYSTAVNLGNNVQTVLNVLVPFLCTVYSCNYHQTEEGMLEFQHIKSHWTGHANKPVGFKFIFKQTISERPYNQIRINLIVFFFLILYIPAPLKSTHFPLFYPFDVNDKKVNISTHSTLF
jgi:hypothetical protein